MLHSACKEGSETAGRCFYVRILYEEGLPINLYIRVIRAFKICLRDLIDKRRTHRHSHKSVGIPRVDVIKTERW
jgi:hypothetical protein